MRGMIPIVVTASTPGGFLTYEPWTPSLDGILAFSSERERLGSDFGTNMDVRPVEGLPLAVTRWGDQWWYECGMPRFTTEFQKEKFIIRRFDTQEAEDRLPGKRKVTTSMGRHKNIRKARLISVGGSVSWAAVGDPDEVKRLLLDMPNVGAGWGRGFGKVAYWRVEEREEEILRPVPVQYAVEHGLLGFMANVGLRPPAWLPENQYPSLVPTHRIVAFDPDEHDWGEFQHCINSVGDSSSRPPF